MRALDKLNLRNTRTRILTRLAGAPPYERCVEAERLQGECRKLIHELSIVRAKAAQELHDEGLSWAEVGELIGTGRGRAHALAAKAAGKAA